MLKMKIDNWKKRIDRQFHAGLSDLILIDARKHPDLLMEKEPVITATNEITNFEFCLEPEEVIREEHPPLEEETIERDYIVSCSIKVYEKYLSYDINSRRASFVNNYDTEDNHCISYFHHYVRNGRYCMNVYVRSMNYRTNFVYDCQTFNKAYNEVFKRLTEKDQNVKQGYIRVFVFSLHNYL